jgi:hypothetical protein
MLSMLRRAAAQDRSDTIRLLSDINIPDSVL